MARNATPATDASVPVDPSSTAASSAPSAVAVTTAAINARNSVARELRTNASLGTAGFRRRHRQDGYECSASGNVPASTSFANARAASPIVERRSAYAFAKRGSRSLTPDEVVEDEDLGVGVRAGADADRRDLDRARDLAAELGRHRLQDDRERAGLLERPRLLEHP